MNIEELLADNLINIITESIIAVDLSGNIIYWNKGAEEIYGYKASEIIGSDTLALYPNESNEVIEKNLKIIKSGYSIRNYLTKRKRKDDTVIDVSITFSALKDKKGNVVGSSVLTRDIAKAKENKRKSQESEIKYKLIFENSGEGFFLMTNKFVEVNKKATEILGYSKEEIIGKSFIDFSPELQTDGTPSEKKAEEYFKKAFKDGNVDFYWQYRRKNLEILETKISLNKISVNGKSHIIAGIQDLTELFKYQNKLEAKTKELITQNKKIIKLNDELDEKNKRLNIITSRSQNLLQIINDIIDISKIEANQLNIEKRDFSLNKLLYELFTTYEIELVNLGKDSVKLEFKTDLSKSLSIINTDELRLKQILSNLINNSLKFTEKGKIEFGYEVKNSFIEFFVRDTGIGIPKEYHKYIFDRFRQANGSSTREFGGTGLGLSICKQLVEMLGGEIWFESETQNVMDGKPGESAFYFTIPNKNKKQANLKKNLIDETTPDLLNKTILIVEDDLISMTFLEELLLGTNATIIKAYNGSQALEKFMENKNINLVLMDIHLPKMSGNEVTKKIKKIDERIPVIAQSAYAMPKEREESFKYGCDDYLIKPIDSRLFFLTLKKFLK